MRAADTIKQIRVDVKRCAECGARFGIDAAFCPFDGVPLETISWDRSSDPRTKDRIRVGDRYEILETLGEGGMGTVYRVKHTVLDRHFAMKVLRRDLATDPDLAQRFLQEARATAAVKHPSVVAITDFGEMEDGTPYFVMELLEGETVATRLRAQGTIPPTSALHIAQQVAEGLTAAHEANVIHRDLKPDNVFLVGEVAGKTTDVRVVDFGAAKIVGVSKLTRPGIVFGTPYYMSPEQASGEPIDGRADVYSLGVLMYEMITGRVPFEADTYMGVLTKHMYQAPAPIVAPSGTPLGDLEAVIMRALAKDPSERYPSMSAFAKALAESEPDEPKTTRTAAPAKSPPKKLGPRGTLPMSTPSTADRIEAAVHRRLADERHRRRRLAGVVLTSALATTALGIGIMVSQRPPTSRAVIEVPPPTATPTPTRTTTIEPTPVAALSTAPVVTAESTPAVPVAAPPATATASVRPSTSPRLHSVATTRASGAEVPPAANTETPSTPSPRPPPTPTPTRDTDEFKDPWRR